MLRLTRLATAVALTAAVTAAQNPFDPLLSAQDPQKPSRPALTITFEVDGSPITLRIEGDDVDADGVTVAEGPTDPAISGWMLGSPVANARVLSWRGAPLARLQTSGAGLSLRFLPRSDRAWLGVDLQPIPDVLAEHLELDAQKVALVAGVRPESPAAKCGLTEHDIVIGVDGRDSAGVDDVRRAIADAAPHAELRLTVLRRGAEMTLTAELGSEPTAARFGGAAVPFPLDVPLLQSLYFTRNATSETEPETGSANDLLYDTAVRNYLTQVNRARSVQGQYKALFDAGGRTYVVPETAPATEHVAKPAGDPTARLERLEAQLERIEALLEKLNVRKDN